MPQRRRSRRLARRLLCPAPMNTGSTRVSSGGARDLRLWVTGALVALGLWLAPGTARALTANLAPNNLALWQLTGQSSTIYGDDSSIAVDGDDDDDWSIGTASLTGEDFHAWWEVDLGQPRRIGSIELHQRTDAAARTTSSRSCVIVAETSRSSTPTSQTRTAGRPTPGSRASSCPTPSSRATSSPCTARASSCASRSCASTRA